MFLTYLWSKELNLNPSAPFSTLKLVMLQSLLCSLRCTVVIRETISTFCEASLKPYVLSVLPSCVNYLLKEELTQLGLTSVQLRQFAVSREQGKQSPFVRQRLGSFGTIKGTERGAPGTRSRITYGRHPQSSRCQDGIKRSQVLLEETTVCETREKESVEAGRTHPGPLGCSLWKALQGLGSSPVSLRNKAALVAGWSSPGEVWPCANMVRMDFKV